MIEVYLTCRNSNIVFLHGTVLLDPRSSKSTKLRKHICHTFYMSKQLPDEWHMNNESTNMIMAIKQVNTCTGKS